MWSTKTQAGAEGGDRLPHHPQPLPTVAAGSREGEIPHCHQHKRRTAICIDSKGVQTFGSATLQRVVEPIT